MDTPQRHYSLLIWTRALSDSLFVLHILRDALEFQNRADALMDLAVRTHQRRSFALVRHESGGLNVRIVIAGMRNRS